MKFLGCQVVFTVLISIVSFDACTEGSFQAGLNKALVKADW